MGMRLSDDRTVRSNFLPGELDPEPPHRYKRAPADAADLPTVSEPAEEIR